MLKLVHTFCKFCSESKYRKNCIALQALCINQHLRFAMKLFDRKNLNSPTAYKTGQQLSLECSELPPPNLVQIFLPSSMHTFLAAHMLAYRAWFKVAVSVTDSDSPETYWSRCISRISADMQNKMIKIFKNY